MAFSSSVASLRWQECPWSPFLAEASFLPVRGQRGGKRVRAPRELCRAALPTSCILPTIHAVVAAGSARSSLPAGIPTPGRRQVEEFSCSPEGVQAVPQMCRAVVKHLLNQPSLGQVGFDIRTRGAPILPFLSARHCLTAIIWS